MPGHGQTAESSKASANKLRRSKNHFIPKRTRERKMSSHGDADVMEIDEEALRNGYKLPQETLEQTPSSDELGQPSATELEAVLGTFIAEDDFEKIDQEELDLAIVEDRNASTLAARSGNDEREGVVGPSQASLLKTVQSIQSALDDLKSAGLPSAAANNSEVVNDAKEAHFRDTIAGLQEKLNLMTSTEARMQQDIQNLNDSLLEAVRQRSKVEELFNQAVVKAEREEKIHRQHVVNLRSEISAAKGQIAKDKEKQQKLMMAIADMSQADPFKIDNSTLRSEVEALRYAIKNWARNQRLVPSLPAQGLQASVNQFLNRNKGPNYEFFAYLTPAWQEYTENPDEMKLLLQAYVWNRLIDMVILDNMWAGTKKRKEEEEDPHRLLVNYCGMLKRLQPDADSSKEYAEKFHNWRSTSCRLIDGRVGLNHRKATIVVIREALVQPILAATSSPQEQELEIDDLDSIIESTMQLGALISKQKAQWVFSSIPLETYGQADFVPSEMTDPYPFSSEKMDSRVQKRAVVLTLAPGLLKYGTNEGTGFDSHIQVLETEVETRIVSKPSRKPFY